MRHVVVVPFNAAWAEIYERAAAEIVAAMGDNLVAVFHIGSTSVEGLAAKPIIDLLVEVHDIEAAAQSNAAMRQVGYETMGAFGIPGRRYYRRDDIRGERTHHVHAFQSGSPHLERHLAFRDYLRAHRDVALQYGELKLQLASQHPRDIEAYMNGKDAFVKEHEAKALSWRRGVSS